MAWAILFFAISSIAQTISQVSFGGQGNLLHFGITTDQGVLIRISTEGNLLEWGTELSSIRNEQYYAPTLQPYLGRMEYYGPETETAFRGKIKSIGACLITYFPSYEASNKAGKLKSVGRLNLDYFDNFAEKSLLGKLKSIGHQELTFYSIMDNEAFRGNLKSIGNTAITYHSSFDDKIIRGKIKTIGSVNYVWFTSFDRFKGGLKSGSYRSTINGITFILR